MQVLGGTGRGPFLRVHTGAGHTDTQVAQVCAALMDFNYGLLLGSLERDANDGEVRLRIAIPYRDASPTAEQVNWCIDIGIGSLLEAMTKIDEIVGKGVAGSVAPVTEI
jgi:hypothetical protein